MKAAGLATIVGAIAIALAAPAHADVDTDFANQLHIYGIYGPKDFNAYLAKIVCDRLGKGRDANAAQSIHFISDNLQRGTTDTQDWQFLGASIATYCPDLSSVWDQAAGQHS